MVVEPISEFRPIKATKDIRSEVRRESGVAAIEFGLTQE